MQWRHQDPSIVLSFGQCSAVLQCFFAIVSEESLHNEIIIALFQSKPGASLCIEFSLTEVKAIACDLIEVFDFVFRAIETGLISFSSHARLDLTSWRGPCLEPDPRYTWTSKLVLVCLCHVLG